MKHFGDIPMEFAGPDAPYVILPVPYDGTSTWVKGSDRGPEALLEASANMELYDIETDTEVYLKGIHTALPVSENTSPEAMEEASYRACLAWLKKGKTVITIGGEHSVSAGPIRAYREIFPDLSVLQLDAHTDLRDEYEGSRYNHACVMARAQDLGCPVVQVGIRSMDTGEKDRLIPQHVFWAQQVQGRTDWWERALDQLTDHVYLTIDLDYFDPSIMSSTGTPEPGGLHWYESLAFLKYVAGRKKIAGFDIVELCPREHNKAPDFLAAKLLYKILSYINL
ncbi:MAG TPA: agmatinase [Bacteroidales bacterium]|nr:agmatinase [Bacteroidales bacterium]HSA42483.1 agmatinase [Bacteroidales bacterium]